MLKADKDILKGKKELRTLCKDILREHGVAVDILTEYTDNAVDVLSYCKKYIIGNYPDAVLYKDNRLRMAIYTKRMKEFFEKNGESLMFADGIVKSDCGISCEDGPIRGASCLTKHKDDEWSKSQKRIMEKTAPNKRVGYKFFCFFKIDLLSADDRELPFENIKPKLDKNLELFVQKIKAFDDMFDTL